jgi:hypothetical protein
VAYRVAVQPPGSPVGPYPGPYPNGPGSPYPNPPGGPYPGAPGGYPPYPPPPAPPRPKTHTGRNVAIILGVLVALVCCGGPAAFGVRYALLANGPYNVPPNLCYTMNSATANRLKAANAPSPEMDEVTAKEPYVGCHWYQQGVFSFMVHVKIYHKSFTHDSIDQSRDLYEFDRRNAGADVAVRDVMIGDQAFLTLDDRNGAEVLDATVRVANVNIMIKYGGPFTSRTQPLPYAEREAELDKFQPVVKDLVADVVEDLR